MKIKNPASSAMLHFENVDSGYHSPLVAAVDVFDPALRLLCRILLADLSCTHDLRLARAASITLRLRFGCRAARPQFHAPADPARPHITDDPSTSARPMTQTDKGRELLLR